MSRCMDLMDPHLANLKGLQLNAMFYDDIVREWALCKANMATLEELSISDASVTWNMDPSLTFPQLKHLSIFVQGILTVDYRTYKKQVADWKYVKRTVDSIQKWMLTHSFPVLECVKILWSTNVLVETIRYGEIDGYDKDGPIYDTEYDGQDEYISMDAALYHFGTEMDSLDFKWMNGLPVKELHLPCALYQAVDTEGTSFAITRADEFTQEEEDELFEKLKDY